MREITFGEALFKAITDSYNELHLWRNVENSSDFTNCAEVCMIRLQRNTYLDLDAGRSVEQIIKTYPLTMMDMINMKGQRKDFTEEYAQQWTYLILKKMEKYL